MLGVGRDRSVVVLALLLCLGGVEGMEVGDLGSVPGERRRERRYLSRETLFGRSVRRSR